MVVPDEEVKTVQRQDESGNNYHIVIGRLAEMRIVDSNTGITLSTNNVPYGSKLYINNGDTVKKGQLICEWDPWNAVIISEVSGKVGFDALIKEVTYREESDEQTGYREKVIIESRDKSKNPAVKILSDNEEVIKLYNLPVSAHLTVEDGATIQAGDILAKIPRAVGKAGDITGGLPRVAEL